MQGLRALCDVHDWLFMVDDVQTGMGRTGTWFGFEHGGVTPDVVTLAKGLGNGVPIGACLARGQAAELFFPGSHGATFGGNPMACRVGCTVLDVMERDGIPARAAVLGDRLLQNLREALADVSGIVTIRGRGLMAGIELDRPCQELVREALEKERLLITVTRDKTVRLLPPLICTEAEIDDIAARVTRLLRQASIPSQ
jgi:acetylornithine aminotransferase